MKMKYRGLAVMDIDGVLCDFETEFCEAFGYDNRNLYSLEARYPKTDPDLVKEFVNNPENYRNASPIFGGNLLLNQLKSRGYYVLLLTSRPRMLKKVTIDWLKKYNIHYSELYFAQNKVEAMRDWHSINRELKLQIFVDDAVSTLKSVALDYPIGSVAFLAWGQPWNEGYYPRLRYNEDTFQVEANMGNDEWKWIWEK